MKTVRARCFINALEGGSSRPVVAEDDKGDRYLVKTRGAGQGAGGLRCEAAATMLARAIGLPALECKHVTLDEEFGAGVLDAELRETLAASEGSNLGFEYLEGARAFEIERDDGAAGFGETEVGIALKDDLFLFDLAVLNVDRTHKNPNMLVHEGKVYSIDYGACLRLLMPGAMPEAAKARALGILRSHPFYREGINCEAFAGKLRGIERDEIEDIVGSMPEAWFGEDGDKSVEGEEGEEGERERFANQIYEVTQDADWLEELLGRLEKMKAETNELRKETARANRDRFKDGTLGA